MFYIIYFTNFISQSPILSIEAFIFAGSDIQIKGVILPRLTLLPFLITLFNSIILSKNHFKAFKGLFKMEEALL